MFFWWLQAILLNNYNIKISEGKYRYFKCNFNEKKNYAHSFDEKHVLLWCDKNETNDESFEFLFFSFFGLAKIWYAKCQLSPSNQKAFFIETYTIQYKTN